MDWKLELIVVPVVDVDRAKAFYSEKLGFHVDVDYSRQRLDANGWMVQEVRRGDRG